MNLLGTTYYWSGRALPIQSDLGIRQTPICLSVNALTCIVTHLDLLALNHLLNENLRRYRYRQTPDGMA